MDLSQALLLPTLFFNIQKSLFMKNQTFSEPSILTAKTFYWKPRTSANQRRKAEENNRAEVEAFFKHIGLETTVSSGGSVTGKGLLPNGKAIEATFQYSESCKNVYKHLQISVDGLNSNIIQLRKLYKL